MPQGTDLRKALEALPGTGAVPEDRDDWRFLDASDERELVELFAPRFYFGCEADDPMVAWAFNAKTNPMGARLRAMFSSDIGHWDVPDFREVLTTSAYCTRYII